MSKQYTVILREESKTPRIVYPTCNNIKEAEEISVKALRAEGAEGDIFLDYIFNGRLEPEYTHIDFPSSFEDQIIGLAGIKTGKDEPSP